MDIYEEPMKMAEQQPGHHTYGNIIENPRPSFQKARYKSRTCETVKWILLAAVLLAILAVGVICLFYIVQIRTDSACSKEGVIDGQLHRKPSRSQVQEQQIPSVTIPTFERDIGDKDREVEILNRTIGRMKVLCPFLYNGKCYQTMMEEKVSFNNARIECMKTQMRLANIYSKEHMDQLMGYIRKNELGNDGGVLDLYLDMLIETSTKKVFMTDGTEAPYLKWDESYPMKNGRYTALLLRVNSDPTEADQYFWNVDPRNSYYFLCETY